jgi:hypothetical protein
VDRFPGPAITMRPVGASGTNIALRVIQSLFMRTADYPLHARHRAHRMRRNELNDLAADDEVEPHVAGFGKPAPEFGHLPSLAVCDADRHLAGPLIVGAVIGNCGNWIAAKPPSDTLAQRLPEALLMNRPLYLLRRTPL